ncbi:MAG: glycosyltransferase family 4 protein [Syntrophales bacterium]|nr:glycosyltransferase family 4 protein [Syntrophales bacterium]
MSLLIINYEYPPIGGGAANASFFLARSLAKLGEEVVVMTSAHREHRGSSRENGVHVHRLPTRRRLPDSSNPLEMGSFLLAGLLWGETIARRHRADKALVFFAVPCGPIGYWLHLRLGLPYVISLRGGDVPGFEPQMTPLHRLLAPCRRGVLRRALAVVANAPGLADLSRRTDPFPVQVIPNGVDTDFFRPPDGPLSASGQEPFAFLFAGRFHAQKNLFYLLDRLGDLQQAGQKPFLLHLVGDGPLRRDLEQYATRLGLQDRLVWHGWLDKKSLRRVYQAVDCFINPSLYEGLPNTVLEAMACGLPVVASRVPGNNDLVKPGKTGYLVKLGDSAAFTLALKSLLDHPEQARKMGEAGRELAGKDFSWDRLALAYLNLFRDHGIH